MREFTFCRQELARDCQRQDGHAHIVIASPETTTRIIPHCRQTTLRQFFYDLDPAAIQRSNAYADDPEKKQKLIDGCFTKEHAEQIQAFVRMIGDLPVVVNCEAGVSRSPGVVLALRRAYGMDTEDVYKMAHPNIHVACLLGRVLGVGPFEQRKHTGIYIPFVEDTQ